MSKKLIEKIVIGVIVLVTIATAVIMPVTSYTQYQHTLAANQQNNSDKTANEKAVLQEVNAKLKDGVSYYDNGEASPKASDFIVTAVYRKGEGEPYEEAVAENKFTVSAPADFYSKGGNVTITYKGKTATVALNLLPVVLEKVEVLNNPYIIKYAVGEIFDKSGVALLATYSDGSTKVITDDAVTVAETAVLALSTDKVTLKYKEGSVEKTVPFPISVSMELDDGAVTKIEIVGDVIVKSGDTLSNAMVNVEAYYESGNRRILRSGDFVIENESDIVKLGNSAEIKVKYAENESIAATKKVLVSNVLQGEDGTIVNGAIVTQTEYVVVNGVITSTGENVVSVGKFGSAVESGKEASVTFNYQSYMQTTGSVTVRAANGNCQFVNGVDKNDGYIMSPTQVNTVLDLTVNGVAVEIPDSVVLKGCGPNSSYAALYNIYSEFVIENVPLEMGENILKLSFKKSTIGEKNVWGESPSSLNIDYVNLTSHGEEIPAGATIKSIEIGDFPAEAGTKYSELNIPVYAMMSNGSKVFLSSEEYTIDIVGFDAQADSIQGGVTHITATLKSDATISAEKTIEINYFYVLNADVVVDNDKVYYCFGGGHYGYKDAQLEFFSDDGFYPILDLQYTDTTFSFKIDVTDLSARTIYPHLNVNGVKYWNGGANKNGDIRGNGLTWEKDKKVTLNNMAYTLKTAYSMPCLEIALDYYKFDKAAMGEAIKNGTVILANIDEVELYYQKLYDADTKTTKGTNTIKVYVPQETTVQFIVTAYSKNNRGTYATIFADLQVNKSSDGVIYTEGSPAFPGNWTTPLELTVATFTLKEGYNEITFAMGANVNIAGFGFVSDVSVTLASPEQSK